MSLHIWDSRFFYQTCPLQVFPPGLWLVFLVSGRRSSRFAGGPPSAVTSQGRGRQGAPWGGSSETTNPGLEASAPWTSGPACRRHRLGQLGLGVSWRVALSFVLSQ